MLPVVPALFLVIVSPALACMPMKPTQEGLPVPADQQCEATSLDKVFVDTTGKWTRSAIIFDGPEGKLFDDGFMRQRI